DAEASPCGPVRHAGGIQGLRYDRLRRGLPDGFGEPADALVSPRRRGLRPAQGRPRGPGTVERRLAMPRFSTTRPVRNSATDMFDLVADVEKYPQFLPLCESLVVRARQQDGGRESLIATMTIAYK